MLQEEIFVLAFETTFGVVRTNVVRMAQK